MMKNLIRQQGFDSFLQVLCKLRQQALFVALLPALWSCVGTIDETGDVDSSVVVSQTDIQFAGIQDAFAIAHNKVVVRFLPATGGSDGNFNYQVFEDGNTANPVASVSGKSAVLDPEGYINVTVTRDGNADPLQMNTEYILNVQALDLATKEADGNTVEQSVRTLIYKVPDFDGITSLSSIPGKQGETELKACWNPVDDAGSLFANPEDLISQYVIYFGLSADQLTNTLTVTDTSKSCLNITSLEPGTTYYVRVRAVNSADPEREELNIKYLSARTNTNAPIQFAGIESASIPSSMEGFTTANVTWAPGSGSFSRYYVYYSPTPFSFVDPSDAGGLTRSPAITDLTSTGFELTNLTSNTTYYAAVLACGDATCGDSKGGNVVRSFLTTPDVYNFPGLLEPLIQPSGSEGLTSLKLTWDPLPSGAVCTNMRFFRINNGVKEQLGDYDGASPNTPGLFARSATEVTVRGLAQDNEYCFMAKCFASTASDARTHANEKVVCGTPEYQSPAFNGINTACTNVTAQSLTVEWEFPEPAGIFDGFRVFKKDNGSVTDINTAIANEDYDEDFILDKNTLSYDLTGLSPSAPFQFWVKAYFQDRNDGSFIYDSNVAIANCATSEAKAQFNGWLDLLAVGPKFNGLWVNGQESVTGPQRFLETVDETTRTPKECPGCTEGVDSSRNGIVRLTWADFDLTDGRTMFDIKDNPNTGYNVYRVEYDPAIHNLLVPPAIDSTQWGSALNADPVVPVQGAHLGQNYTYGEFIDYNHSHAQAATHGKIYWYKVQAVSGGTELAFQSSAPDQIIKVILPPKNMGLVHRWIANKTICDLLDRDVDRSSNYSCQYNGLGSENGRYDIEGHTLVDRFELSAKWSRQACVQATGDTAVFFGASTDPSNGVLSGDCIEYQDDPGFTLTYSDLSAPEGAVKFVYQMYSHRTRKLKRFFLNTSDTFGNTWSEINNASSTLDAGVHAQAIFSNDSKLPQLTRAITVDEYSRACNSFNYTLPASTPNNYSKHLPNRKEQWVAIQWPFSFSNEDIANAERSSGQFNSGCNSKRSTKGASQEQNLRTDHYADINTTQTNFLATESIREDAPLVLSGSNLTSDCSSRFGLQDHFGNIGEITVDQFYCRNFSGSFGCDAKRLDESGGEFVASYRPENQEQNLRNPSGEYLSYTADSNSMGDTYSQSPAKVFIGTSTNNRNFSYLNVALGLALACKGTSCNSGSDDNTLIASNPLVSSRIPATALVGRALTDATRGAFGMGVLWSQFYASTAFYFFMTRGYETADNTISGNLVPGNVLSGTGTYYHGFNSNGTRDRYYYVFGARCFSKIDDAEYQ